MLQRRIALLAAIAACAVLIALKPPTGQIRLALDTGNESAPALFEAAVEVGAVGVSVVVDASRRLR
ncbi:hypothetical protein [Sphingomonas baiyangensis]|uniref:Uncharacterized protein n=1 Tax=Sphingomonas baiyangensis TaxID=2572576 RepID=A0A4U1L7S0_9SPHN|nr:hypothetical protein [Sphingomonas baiyangensis]TKD53007.1 hypothetical protein FBR43_01290 [Sphingomonas baiyangensis]